MLEHERSGFHWIHMCWFSTGKSVVHVPLFVVSVWGLTDGSDLIGGETAEM